jgi:hypothetical protein
MTCLRGAWWIAAILVLACASTYGATTAPTSTAAPALAAGPAVSPTATTPTYVPAPFTMDKAYSADMDVALRNGLHLRGHMSLDTDKLRAEWNMNGIEMAAIVRKDQMKVYDLMTSQKIAMVMDLDASKLKGNEAAMFGPEGKFELIGPDSVNGVACTKYKVTSDKNGSVVYFWLDLGHKVPVAVASVDGGFSAKWTNYKQGPQDAALFEVPADYNLMPMPAGMGIPGASGGPETAQ